MHSNNWQLDISITETLKCLETKDELDIIDNFMLYGTIQVSFIISVSIYFTIQTRTFFKVKEIPLNITTGQNELPKTFSQERHIIILGA